MKAPSSMMVGTAPAGSSTPPICVDAAMWMFFPTWAQEPMVTWLSTIEPESTYAPTFMYAGGITMAPGAR